MIDDRWSMNDGWNATFFRRVLCTDRYRRYPIRRESFWSVTSPSLYRFVRRRGYPGLTSFFHMKNLRTCQWRIWRRPRILPLVTPCYIYYYYGSERREIHIRFVKVYFKLELTTLQRGRELHLTRHQSSIYLYIYIHRYILKWWVNEYQPHHHG